MPERAEPTAPNLLGVVETTVIGILVFARRLLTTCALAALRPARLGRIIAADAAKEKARVVGPYTFICLTGFYSVKFLRIALIVVLLIPLSIFKGCEAETTEELRWPNAAQIVLPPSVDELLLIGLPLIAACLGLSWLIWKLLEGRSDRQRQVYIQAACYCFGLELLLVLPLCALLAAWAWSSPLWGGTVLGDELAMFALLGAIFATLVSWPAFSMYRMLGAARAVMLEPGGRGPGKIGLAAAALVAALAMAIVGFGMSYPAARSEFVDKYKPKPLLGMAPIGPSTVAPGEKLTVAVWNRTDTAMQFGLDKAMVHGADGRAHDATVTGKPNPTAPIFQLQARERSWVAVTAGAATADTWTVTHRGAARLCLAPVQGSAPQDIICAWIDAAPSRACDWKQSRLDCLARWFWVE